MWSRLQEIFQSKAATRIVNLCHEFFQTFAEDGANMEEHICKLHGLHQQLNARGQLITNEDFTNTLLTSLPDTWSPFITTINATGAAISSEILIARILDEDHTQKASIAQQTALKAHNPGKKPKGGPNAMRGKY